MTFVDLVEVVGKGIDASGVSLGLDEAVVGGRVHSPSLAAGYYRGI